MNRSGVWWNYLKNISVEGKENFADESEKLMIFFFFPDGDKFPPKVG